MEFVFIILCAAMMVQTKAAPLPRSLQTNQFDLPDIARNGFELTLEASIHNEFKEQLEQQMSWKVIMETDEEAKFCEVENVKGMHICIMPKDDKPCDDSITTVFKLRVKAIVNKANEDELLLQVYLNESHQIERIVTFEEFKHVSMGGVIGDIQKLHFDFSERAKAG